MLFDTIIPFGEHRSCWKSHYLPELSDEMIDEFLAAGAEAPSDNTLSSIWNLGGGVTSVADDATALGDRSMRWMYSIDSIWTDAAEDERNISWTREVWERTRRHSLERRLYLNFGGHGE